MPKRKIPKKIDVKVSRHPSGRRTLMEKASGPGQFQDLKGNLRGNKDDASFYRAVAKRFAQHSKRGIVIRSYRDSKL